MSVFQATILGFVQGLTEFLPISSSGHLIFIGGLIGVESVSISFELLTHLATLLAVFIVMRKAIWGLIKKPLQKTNLLIIVATVPTVLIFFLFRNIFEAAFDGRWLAICFLITAILLVASSLVKRKEEKKLTVFGAIVIGVMQGAAGLPGISRSGITIAGGKFMGMSQKNAAEFSFLISIPIILGSSIFSFISNGFVIDIALVPAIFGFIAAFISGLVALTILLKLFSKISFNGFAVYLVVISITTIILQLLQVL